MNPWHSVAFMGGLMTVQCGAVLAIAERFRDIDRRAGR